MNIYKVDENSSVKVLEEYSYEDDYGRYCSSSRYAVKKPLESDYGLYFRNDQKNIVRLTPDCRILPAYSDSHSFKDIINADIVGEIGLGSLKVNFPIKPVLHISEMRALDVFQFKEDLIDFGFYPERDKTYSSKNVYIFLNYNNYSIKFCDLDKNMFYAQIDTTNIFMNRGGELILKIKDEEL